MIELIITGLLAALGIVLAAREDRRDWLTRPLVLTHCVREHEEFNNRREST